MKANERISGAPRTSIWRSARAKATHTMPIPSFKLAATRSAPKFLSSHRETALCSSLTETHPLHPYCKQTLRHGKLQDALAGSMLGSSGPRLASRRPWWYLQVDRSSSGRARPTHIGGLEVWVSHHENRPISPRLCWFECMKVNERILSAPRTSVWRPARVKAARTMSIPPSKLAATEISLISPRNGSLQLFDRDTSITLLLQEHTLPWQTSKCSSRVDGGLFAAWVGSTSPLVAPSSQLQQLWLFQAIAHWWFWKFGSPSRKSSDPFTSQLVSMHESEESRLECPSCIGLAPHTS